MSAGATSTARALPIGLWLTTLLVAAIDALWTVAGHWHISSGGLTMHGAILLLCLSILLFPRYRSEPRVSLSVQAVALLVAFSNATAILSYLIVSTDAPLVDAKLYRWDNALGFDWQVAFNWMQQHRQFRHLAHIVYGSIFPQMVILVFFLGFTGRHAALSRFLVLYVVCSVLTVLLAGPFPAAGPLKYLHVHSEADLQLLSQFEPLRSGAMRTIDLKNIQGLISIPSMHMELALLLTLSMWRTVLAWPFLILNLLVVLSTPIEGGHYMVDLLAGGVLVMVVMAVPGFRMPSRIRSPDGSTGRRHHDEHQQRRI